MKQIERSILIDILTYYYISIAWIKELKNNQT